MVDVITAPQFGASDLAAVQMVSIREGSGSTPSTVGRLSAQKLIDLTIASGSAAVYASWAALNAVTGAAGDVAFVPVDAGTHADVVTSETVDNSGCYEWSTSPAGWARFADTLDQSAAKSAADAAAVHVAAAYEVKAQVDDKAAAAEISAATAAAAASTAESVSGPTYASLEEGEDLTPPGKTFAVGNGDGTVSIWLRTSGASVLQRTLATTALLSSTSGAANVVTSTGETVEKVAATARRGVDSSEIVAALAAAAAGRKIILDRPYNITSTVTMNFSAEGDIEMRPGAGFTNTSGTQLTQMIKINANGKNIRIIGPDYSVPLIGNDKATVLIEIEQSNGLLSPEIEIRGFFAQGAKLWNTGTVTGQSAMGIALFGRMRARILGNRADGIRREAGTASVGNSGTFAFVVAERSGLIADSIDFLNNQWDNLYTADTYGGSLCYDVDGAILKVGDNTGNPIRADGNRSGPNCMGRDLKFQGLGADVVVGRHDFARGLRGITGGCPIIDLQTERGIVGRVVGMFTGSDVHLERWTIVDISPRTAGDPFPRHFGDIDIDDRSTGTNGIWALFGATPQAAAVSGGKTHEGTSGRAKVKGKAVRNIIDCGNTAAMAHNHTFGGFDGSVSNALAIVGTNPTGLRLHCTDMKNRATAVPAVKRVDAAGLSINWGQHYNWGGCSGFFDHDGNHAAASTGSSLSPSLLDPRRGTYFTSDSRATVRRPIAPITLAAGATSLIGDGLFGYSGSGARLRVRSPAATALYVCDLYINGSTGTISNASHSLFTWGGVLSSAPTTPTGQFIFWRSSGDSKYYVTSTFGSANIIDFWE